MEKSKAQNGFGLVHLLIIAAVVAAVLLGVSQLNVTMKDVQKVQEQKLAYVEKVREVNDVIDRPVACRCNFQGLPFGAKSKAKLTGIRIFKENDCKDVIRVVLDPNQTYHNVKFSMGFVNLRQTTSTEILVDLFINGERKSGARKKDMLFMRTMRFDVTGKDGELTVVSCKS